jgi:hypothetical protein
LLGDAGSVNSDAVIGGRDADQPVVVLKEVNYSRVFKAVWLMCAVETGVFLMTFSYVVVVYLRGCYLARVLPRVHVLA